MAKKIKIKAKRFINLGKINGKLVYFHPDRVYEVELIDEIARAIEDGFLEVVEETKEKVKKEKKTKKKE